MYLSRIRKFIKDKYHALSEKLFNTLSKRFFVHKCMHIRDYEWHIYIKMCSLIYGSTKQRPLVNFGKVVHKIKIYTISETIYHDMVHKTKIFTIFETIYRDMKSVLLAQRRSKIK